MNLYQEILADILSREEICIEFPNLTNHASELVEMKSYQTLKQIKEIIEDDELTSIRIVFKKLRKSCVPWNRSEAGEETAMILDNDVGCNSK